MKARQLFLSSGLIFLINSLFAVTPLLNLSGSATIESVNLTLNIKNFKQVSDIKFNGLKNYQVIRRDEGLNLYSMNDADDKYITQLSLIPTKAESALIYATASIDGKTYTSNAITIVFNQAQLEMFKKNQQRQQQAFQQKVTAIQQKSTQKMQMQQQFFESIERVVHQHEAEMEQSDPEFDKAFESGF